MIFFFFANEPKPRQEGKWSTSNHYYYLITTQCCSRKAETQGGAGGWIADGEWKSGRWLHKCSDVTVGGRTWAGWVGQAERESLGNEGREWNNM